MYKYRYTKRDDCCANKTIICWHQAVGWAAFAAARYGPAGLTPAAMLRIPGQRSSAGRPVDFVWEGGRAG